MGYGGYAGDPRGRERAIESRQQDREEVQSQVDSFRLIGNDREGYDWVRVAPTPKQVSTKGPSQDRMRFRTYSAPLPTPKTPVQKAYNEIRTKTPDMTTTKSQVAPTPKQVPIVDTRYTPAPKKTVIQKIYENVVGSPAKPANLWGNKIQQGHFANSQIIENQVKLGNISHKYADQLKGKDVAQQGLNPMLGMLIAGPYQMITNAIDQGDIWGGITSGANQAVSNIQGILSAYGMWDIGSPPPQSDSNSAWLDLLQQITQMEGN